VSAFSSTDAQQLFSGARDQMVALAEQEVMPRWLGELKVLGPVLDKYSWLILLLWAIGSTLSVRSKLRGLAEDNPKLSAGHRAFLCGYFLFLGLP
jgi:hypothetical protein